MQANGPAATATETGVRTISPGELQQLRAGGAMVDLIDVRTPVEFEQVHAEGARLAPLSDLDVAAVVAGRAAGAGEPVYVICKSGGRAAKACAAFAAAGHVNVVSVAGGTDAWVAAGLPVVRGQSRVISLERQVRIAAGAMVIVGVLLGFLVHPALFGLAGFVGAGLVFAGVTDTCGMGMMLARMPWNRGCGGGGCCAK